MGKYIAVFAVFAFCIVNLLQTYDPKLRIVILLHLGLATFRLYDWRTRHLIIFVISGFVGRIPDSQHQYYLSLGTPGYFPKHSKNNIVGSRNFVDLGNFEIVGKDGHRTIMNIRIFWK